MNLLELYAKVGLDTTEFEQGIDTAQKKFNSFADVFKGTFLADLARDSMRYVADFGKQAVGLASDLAEVQNVVDVTFGSNSGAIDRWAKNAKTAFGMGELSAKKYAGTMGAMLVSMGLTDEEAFEMSTSIVQLAGDMASFYNLDHDTAFEKIRAGIAGETEPLKQLGINMSVANLEAYAMSKGIDKVYSSMTQAEQAALRYGYLLEATAGAQGDFARTAEGYASQLRLFEENVNSILENAGSKIIEIINPILQQLNEYLMEFDKKSVAKQISDIEDEEFEALGKAEIREMRAMAMIDVLEELDGQVEMNERDADIWKNTLQKLVQLFPELAEHIDLETGKIKTNTEAMRDNVKVATENARDKARIAALQKKQGVLEDAYQAEIEAETNVRILEQQQKERYEAVRNIVRAHPDYLNADDATVDAEISKLINGDPVTRFDFNERFRDQIAAASDPSIIFDWARSFAKGSSISADVWKYRVEQSNPIEALIYTQSELTGAREVLAAMREETALAEEEYFSAEKALLDMGYAAEDVAKATSNAAEAEADYASALQDTVTAFTEMEEAYNDVYEYREKVYSDMRESLRNGTDDLWGIVADMTKADIAGSGEIVKQNMAANAKFYADYAANLRMAKEMGLDENLLSELAQDHSAENAALLRYVVEGGDVTELNASWAALETAKGEFADTAAEAILEVDDAFSAMLEIAEESVEKFEMAEMARQNAAATAGGVVEGLESKIPEIQERVDQINKIMESIGHGGLFWEGGEDSSGGFSIGLGGGVTGAIETAMYNGAFGGIRAGLAGQKVGVELGGMLPNINAGLMGLAVAGRYG